MRHLHHLEPLVALAFERRDSLPDGIDQNLAAAAGNRTEPRFLKTRDHFVQRHLERLGKMLELRRAEAVDVDMGIFFPDVMEQIEIPIEAELRMMAALHQDLHAARCGQLIQLLVELFAREHVMIVVLFGAIKRAELAVNVADVGVIDVAIDDVSDDFAASVPIMLFFRQVSPGGERR